jgi:hypothetical protein
MVILHINDPMYARLTRDHKCVVCQGTLQPPFLEWNESSGFCICRECCRTIKKGFMADLIQVSAIMELRDLGYLGSTFERVDIDVLKKREALLMKESEQ